MIGGLVLHYLIRTARNGRAKEKVVMMKTEKSNPPTKFSTIEQIADCTEASTRTVQRWIKQKLLIAHKIGGLVRISETDFQAFLAAHRDR